MIILLKIRHIDAYARSLIARLRTGDSHHSHFSRTATSGSATNERWLYKCLSKYVCAHLS